MPTPFTFIILHQVVVVIVGIQTEFSWDYNSNSNSNKKEKPNTTPNASFNVEEKDMQQRHDLPGFDI